MRTEAVEAQRSAPVGLDIAAGAGERNTTPAAIAPADALADELENVLLREDKRGTPVTVLGNKITAEECRKVLNEDYPDLADRIEHYAGSYKDGKEPKEKMYQAETNIRVGGSYRRPDSSWRLEGEKKTAHINTVSVRKDGTMTVSEQAAYEDIAQAVGKELIEVLSKLRKDEDLDEFRRRARTACQRLFRRWLGEPTRH